MIQPMKAVSIALFAAVNHDLERVKRQFKALVQKNDTTAQAQLEH
jgi:hypothetical protein